MRKSLQNSRFRSRRGGVFKSAVALLTFTSALGVLGWMLLSPDALELEIEARTGFPVDAEVLVVDPFGLTVTGENVVIGNPSAYGGGAPLMEIARLEMNASLPAMGRSEIWIYDMELYIPRATLVVNEGGRLNLDAFAGRLFADAEDGDPLPFFAEKVRLVVDELTFVDNSQIVPRSRSLRVSLDTELHDLEQSRDIFGPLFELARRVGSLPVQ
ncbi:hypothetical protein [Pelagicoccus mobilis]|uniref:Uncharacterized protein n=1 Tax=Pelagicoccus mobilis TaxID=415221 RepID=A0A934VPH5_9BACT|nr:hypothetical protein [Pelagicoccus mobilis]MBK1875539.1 hypothetical protein [Pelagicoccus mobilis]